MSRLSGTIVDVLKGMSGLVEGWVMGRFTQGTMRRLVCKQLPMLRRSYWRDGSCRRTGRVSSWPGTAKMGTAGTLIPSAVK
jgi:hypothetical protein